MKFSALAANGAAVDSCRVDSVRSSDAAGRMASSMLPVCLAIALHALWAIAAMQAINRSLLYVHKRSD